MSIYYLNQSQSATLNIRNTKSSDAQGIAEIYNHYILHEIATFEEELIDAGEMLRRMNKVQPKYPWLVCENNSKILGYAYATAWNERSAYRHSAESTIYLDRQSLNRGVGTKLYKTLIDRLRNMGMHTVIGGISLPNEGSVRLHENLGYKKCAHYYGVGRKFDQWIDVGYWQLIF